MNREAVVVAAVRTPVGRIGGALSGIRPDDLAAHVIRAALDRVPGFELAGIRDVYFGCANQAGEDNRNVARMAVLLSGLPDAIPGCTVNRLCASGLEAVNMAARCILVGEGDAYIAGGVESMSRAPWAIPKPESGYAYGNLTAYDTALGWRFPNPKLERRFPLYSMGETAENIAQRYGIARREQDAYALESHRKALAAIQGIFQEEISSIPVLQRKGPQVEVSRDEGPRPGTTMEKLSALRPAFREGGSVTAGNSCAMSDGAAAIVLMELQRARALGLTPLARWAGAAGAGVDPSVMGLGPVFSTRSLLDRRGLSVGDIDLFELNEAFAVQVLACCRELNLPMDKLNVHGGAIALGHPLGASGARLVTTLVHEMRRRGARRGLAALCVGVGQGHSTIFEAL